MDTIKVTSPKPLILKRVAEAVAEAVPRWWKIDILEEDSQISIATTDGGLFLHFDLLPEEGGCCVMYIDYVCVDDAKTLLEKIVDNPELEVDLDFGLVLPGDEVARRCRTEANWNWRSPSQ